MSGGADTRSRLERHIVPITIGLTAVVFLLIGLAIGGVFSSSNQSAQVAAPTVPPTTQPATTSEPAATGATAVPATTSAPSTSTSTTSIPLSSPPGTVPEWVVTPPDDTYFFHPVPLHLGDVVDLDTFTVGCTEGCDLEVIELIGVHAQGYTAVLLPVGGAEVGLMDPVDPNAPTAKQGVLDALTPCREGSADIDVNKQPAIASPEHDPLVCVRTDEGNWTVLAANDNPQSFSVPILLSGMTLAPPGWTAERATALLP